MPTDQNTTKAYSDFAAKWAEKLSTGTNLSHQYLEKPAMYSKLPDLRGKKVLCVGCGTGEECQHLHELGAIVTGIDVSPGLINYAKKQYSDLDFRVMDMENIILSEKTFDYVYSSLTMHYVDSWIKTLNSIKRVMKDEAVFLFSTHHPVKWGALRIRDEVNELRLGATWTGENCEVQGEYLNTKKINDIWFGELEVTYYNRPISALLKDVRESGFEVLDFLEPKSINDPAVINTSFYKIHQTIPLFIIFELKIK